MPCDSGAHGAVAFRGIIALMHRLCCKLMRNSDFAVAQGRGGQCIWHLVTLVAALKSFVNVILAKRDAVGSLSVQHADMAAAVAAASDGAFAVFYRTAVDADPIQVSVREAAAVEFESAAPFRRLRSRHGQRNFVGAWWMSTTKRHVTFESWCRAVTISSHSTSTRASSRLRHNRSSSSSSTPTPPIPPIPTLSSALHPNRSPLSCSNYTNSSSARPAQPFTPS
jgi:hypothetical protein